MICTNITARNINIEPHVVFLRGERSVLCTQQMSQEYTFFFPAIDINKMAQDRLCFDKRKLMLK